MTPVSTAASCAGRGGGLLERRCICLFAKDARTSNVPMVVVAGAMRAQAVPQGFSDARVFRRGP